MAGICANIEAEAEVAFAPVVVLEPDPVVENGAVVGCTTTVSNFEHKLFQVHLRVEWRRICGNHKICYMFKNDEGSFECKACLRISREIKFKSPLVLVYLNYGGKNEYAVVEQHHWERQRINYDIKRGLLSKRQHCLMRLTKWFKRHLQRTWFMYILWRRSFHRSMRHRLLRQWFTQFQKRQTFMHYLQHRWFTRYQQYRHLLTTL